MHMKYRHINKLLLLLLLLLYDDDAGRAVEHVTGCHRCKS